MSGLIALGVTVMGRLLPARFRGARFYVDSAGGTYGRRFADHQYPGRDKPFAEDLGREQRVWQITGYTIGPTFRIQRDMLLKACERKGPGTLFHPAIGPVQAVCRRVQWNEARDAGLYCTFTLEFAEPGELAAPVSEAGTAQAIESAADALGEAASAAFESVFDVTNALSYVADFAGFDVQGVAVLLERMRKPLAGLDQSGITEALSSLYDTAHQLVHAPADLVAATADCFAQFSGAGDAVTAGLSMLTMATDYVSGQDEVDVVPPISTVGSAVSGMAAASPRAADPPGTEYSSSAQLTRNQGAWQRFVREQALREVGYLTPGMDIASYHQAERIMEAMQVAFDGAETAAADAGNDQVYIALIDLRGACMADIMARRGSLKPLVAYHMPRTTNAITMAWRFYHDANRDLELVDMVNAYTPAFMPIRGTIKVE